MLEPKEALFGVNAKNVSTVLEILLFTKPGQANEIAFIGDASTVILDNWLVVTVWTVEGYVPGDKPNNFPKFALVDDMTNCIVFPLNVIPVGLLPPDGNVIG